VTNATDQLARAYTNRAATALQSDSYAPNLLVGYTSVTNVTISQSVTTDAWDDVNVIVVTDAGSAGPPEVLDTYYATGGGYFQNQNNWTVDLNQNQCFYGMGWAVFTGTSMPGNWPATTEHAAGTIHVAYRQLLGDTVTNTVATTNVLVYSNFTGTALQPHAYAPNLIINLVTVTNVVAGSEDTGTIIMSGAGNAGFNGTYTRDVNGYYIGPGGNLATLEMTGGRSLTVCRRLTTSARGGQLVSGQLGRAPLQAP